MVRTVISLDAKQKKWLDSQAKKKNVPMTQVVREAVTEYMVHDGEPSKPKRSMKELLELTHGTWKGEDGLAYQLKMRKEWDREWD